MRGLEDFLLLHHVCYVCGVAKKIIFLHNVHKNTIASWCDDVPLSFQQTTVTMSPRRLLRSILPTIKAEIDGTDAIIGDCK
jgi:hypothetical protein